MKILIKIGDMRVDFYTYEHRECRTRSVRREARAHDVPKPTKTLVVLVESRKAIRESVSDQ